MLARTGSKNLEKQRALEQLLAQPAVAPAEVLFGGAFGSGAGDSNIHKTPLEQDTFENENQLLGHVTSTLDQNDRAEEERRADKRKELSKILSNRELRYAYMHRKRKEAAEASRLYELQQTLLDEDKAMESLIQEMEKREEDEANMGGFKLKPKGLDEITTDEATSGLILPKFSTSDL